jgi:hypothetical protein
MKTIASITTIILMLVVLKTSAQEFINSRATISVDSDVPIPFKDETVLILLNEQTSFFSVSSCILLRTVKLNNDSSATSNKPLFMNFKAPFPITNLDFYDPNNDKKQYTMNGELTIAETTKPFTIDFNLHSYASQNTVTNDFHSYPALISFTMQIDPDDYNLQNVPSCFSNFCFAKLIMVSVQNGTINKSNESGKQPECQASSN